MQLTTLPMLILGLLVLATCSSTNIREYPTEWAQIGNKNTSEQCPNVSGYYSNFGEQSNEQGSSLLCTYLSIQLLSTGLQCKRVLSGGNIVELRQPEQDQLKINIWAKTSNNETMNDIYEQTLSVERKVILPVKMVSWSLKSVPKLELGF